MAVLAKGMGQRICDMHGRCFAAVFPSVFDGLLELQIGPAHDELVRGDPVTPGAQDFLGHVPPGWPLLK